MVDMGKRRSATNFAFALGAAVITTTGCSMSGDDHDGFSNEEWQVVMNMQPLATEMTKVPTNAMADNDAVARIGQMLFFEKAWADPLTVDNVNGKKGETGKVGCVTCHDPAHMMADTRPGVTTSAGLGAPGRRNAPTMANLGWFNWWGWTARFDTLTMHGSGAVEAQTTRLSGIQYVYKNYLAEYNEAFPNYPLTADLEDATRFPPAGRPKATADAPNGPWESMTEADQKVVLRFMNNLGRAWEAYPRKLVTRNSPFARYTGGESEALSPGAKRGLKLFIGKAACNDCHNGPIMSDSNAHNVAVSNPPGATTLDQGRFPDLTSSRTNIWNGIGEYSDDKTYGEKKLNTMPPATDTTMTGAFRTPMLVNIAETGPYFHTGLLSTLDEVVRHYNKGGGEPGTFAGTKDPRLQPLGLTDAEMSDLVEFLKSLTGTIAEADKHWWTNNAKSVVTP